MCIKILGDKKIRDNKVIVLRIGNKVVKIPLTIGAVREMSDEKERIKRAENDDFFSDYLPDYKFFLFFQILPYLPPRDTTESDYIKRYFRDLFENISICEKVELENLVDECFLEFVKNHTPDDYNLFAGCLKKIFLPCSSAHGDFHPENILYSGVRLCFIDWSRYNDKSSRYFDIVDFYIFSRKNKDEAWTRAWEREFNNYSGEILGIRIKKEYLLAYSIWKTAEDIRVLKIRGKLDSFKIKKYINFLKILKNFITTYENKLHNPDLR